MLENIPQVYRCQLGLGPDPGAPKVQADTEAYMDI